MNDIRRPLIAELHRKREIVLAGPHALDAEIATMVGDGYITEQATLKHRIIAITELGDAAYEELEQAAVAEEAERQKEIAEQAKVRRASDAAFKQRAQQRASRAVKVRVIE